MRLAMWLNSMELLRTSAHASCRLCPAGAQDAAAKSKKTAEKVAKQKSMVGWFSFLFFFVVGLCLLCARSCEWWVMWILLLFKRFEWAPHRTDDAQGFPGHPCEFMSSTHQVPRNAQAGRLWMNEWATCGHNNYIIVIFCLFFPPDLSSVSCGLL